MVYAQISNNGILVRYNSNAFAGYTDSFDDTEFQSRFGISYGKSFSDIRQQKYDEVSAACQQAIYDGFDAEVETGTEHFSLKNEDQINLQTANEAIKSGAMGYPYHSDGNLCRLFKADEITTLANAAVQHKLYHTTYCNHLMRWIDRVETVDELNQIYYGADLPEDLKKNMEQVMAGVKTTM